MINYINIHHFKVMEALILCWYAVAGAGNEIYDSPMFVLQNIFSLGEAMFVSIFIFHLSFNMKVHRSF